MLELKSSTGLEDPIDGTTYNRTMLELKCLSTSIRPMKREPYNRTMLELKYVIGEYVTLRRSLIIVQCLN